MSISSIIKINKECISFYNIRKSSVSMPFHIAWNHVDELFCAPFHNVFLLAYSTLFFIVRIVFLERHFEFIDIVSQ